MIIDSLLRGKEAHGSLLCKRKCCGVLTVIAEELKGIRKEQKTTNEGLAAVEGKVGQAATDEAHLRAILTTLITESCLKKPRKQLELMVNAIFSSFGSVKFLVFIHN